MNIYKKLATARVMLQETEIKKTGYNPFAKFQYFELSDFLPTINKMNSELGLLTIFSMSSDKASLKIINADKSDEVVEFEIPFITSEVKGANAVQNLGATETYLRRYLFLAAYEITDGEVFDSLNKDQKNIENKKTGPTPEPKKEKVESISGLKSKLNKINSLDQEVLYKFLEYYRVETVESLTEKQIDKIINWVNKGEIK